MFFNNIILVQWNRTCDLYACMLDFFCDKNNFVYPLGNLDVINSSNKTGS